MVEDFLVHLGVASLLPNSKAGQSIGVSIRLLAVKGLAICFRKSCRDQSQDWCNRLKGVVSKNLQKPYIIIMWYKGGITVGVTVHTMLTHLSGATDDRGGYHLSRCHTPLGRVLQVFINNAF